jgi:hypothetical protein
VVAELSGLVGWLCHDSNMPGPAQRYLMYGLQAARESTDPRAPLLVIGILSDMALHMSWLKRPDTALRLHDLAMSQLPADRRRFNALRAALATKRAANGLCQLGPSSLPEVRNALDLSLDLYDQASDEDRESAATMWHRAFKVSEVELSAIASTAYLVLARDDRRLAAEAEARTLHHLANVRLETEIAGDSVFDLSEFVAFEVVHRVADDVVRVDAAYLVDEESRVLTVDLQRWAEDGLLGGGGRRHDRCDAPRHGGWAKHKPEAFAALFVSAFGLSEINPVDRTTYHHASASLLSSSLASRSASSRARDSQTSRSSRRRARRMTSLVRSSGRIAALMIRSSSSVGRKPMVVAILLRLSSR